MQNSKKPLKNGVNTNINKHINLNVSQKHRIHSVSNDVLSNLPNGESDFQTVQNTSKRNLSSKSSDFKTEAIKKKNLFSHLQINTPYLQTKMLKPKTLNHSKPILIRTPKPNQKSNLLHPSL